MQIRLPFLLLCALAFFTPVIRATTVVPPSFPELVSAAEAIYRGRVTAVESRHVPRADGAGQVIKTFVTVAVDKVLKGEQRAEVVLEFLGGKVGDEVLRVQGMPTFTVGAQEYVFVQKNGRQFCPLVAVMHGRYRVLRDAAESREFIARDNRVPLTDVAEVGLPMTELPAEVRAGTAATATARALTPAAFEAHIRSEVQAPTVNARIR
jgi:hypothetical protein